MSKDNKKQQYTNNTTRNIKVALFAILALVILYVGIKFLKGIKIFGHKQYYYGVFEDVGGLHESTNLLLNGYPIGKVTEVSLLSSNPVRICAEFMVTEDLDIPSDSKFLVAQTDILGGVAVNVVLGSSPKMAAKGDTLSCGIQGGGLTDGLDDLKGQLSSVLSSIDTIGLSLKQSFNPNDEQNGAIMLKSTLVNLEATTQHLNKLLANNEAKVTNAVSKLNELSTTLNDASPKIDAIINNLDNITDSIAQSNVSTLINDAQQTVNHLNAITSSIEKGEGSVGQLMNNDSLYNNINSTVEQLNTLLKDFQAHPSRYINIFGRKKDK
ncbi:MAG: MlaD family protein [Bacteroidales bacterium]|nr:MlaD family protein [Bacteroidales bacterium]